MNSESDSPIDILNSSESKYCIKFTLLILGIPVILNESIFDPSKYQILEVPEQLVDQVLSNKTFIKPSTIDGRPEKSVPALMTEDEGSYYMQILETTGKNFHNFVLLNNHDLIL